MNYSFYRKLALESFRGQKPLSGNYDALKKCIITKDKVDEIDTWFKGIVESVTRYKPNTRCLVFNGRLGIGKSSFFSDIFPDGLEFYTVCMNKPSDNAVYNTLITDIKIGPGILSQTLPAHNPVTYLADCGNPTLEKRLTSFCSTWNDSKADWKFTRRLIVINVESIDWEIYNSIDKKNLWIEIFQKFKK